MAITHPEVAIPHELDFRGSALVNLDEKGRFSFARELGICEAVKKFIADDRLSMRLFSVDWKGSRFLVYVPLSSLPRTATKHAQLFPTLNELPDAHMDKLKRLRLTNELSGELNVKSEVFIYGIGLGLIVAAPQNQSLLTGDKTELFALLEPLFTHAQPDADVEQLTFTVSERDLAGMLRQLRRRHTTALIDAALPPEDPEGVSDIVRDRIQVVVQIKRPPKEKKIR